MVPFSVVVLHELLNSHPQLNGVITRIHVDVFAFDGPPEVLNPDIVLCASASTHADFHSIPTGFYPKPACVLAPMIGVDDFKGPESRNRLLEDINRLRCVQGVAQHPRQNASAVKLTCRPTSSVCVRIVFAPAVG